MHSPAHRQDLVEEAPHQVPADPIHVHALPSELPLGHRLQDLPEAPHANVLVLHRIAVCTLHALLLEELPRRRCCRQGQEGLKFPRQLQWCSLEAFCAVALVRDNAGSVRKHTVTRNDRGSLQTHQ